MIRNGYRRHLAAEAERARLAEQWQTYPESVQYALMMLLHDHGLQAAQRATEIVEQYAQWQQGLFSSGKTPQVK